MTVKKKLSRIWSYGSNALVSTLLFLGILAFVAVIAERHPWRVDLTESGTFTLSEQSRNVLKSVNEPVAIKAFFATAAPAGARAKDLLETYSYYNKNISFEFIDPDREPEVARRYEVRAYETLVLERHDKKQTVQTVDEETVTNAILRLTRDEEKKIYFLIGHGEHSLEGFDKEGYSSIRSALQKENYNVLELNLLQREKVPDDAAAVIVAGPQKALFDQEIVSLKTYLESGGKLLLLLDPYSDSGLRAFLKSYGIEISDDIVIDKLSRVFGGSYLMPVVTGYGFHKITDNFNVATFYPEARSVRPMQQIPEGVQVEILASTSPNAWAETDLELLKQGQASFEEKSDRAGPVPLLVIAEVEGKEMKTEPPAAKQQKDQAKTREKKKSKSAHQGYMIICGDSDFVNNTHFGLSGNGDFFLNMVNYLAEEENLITIEPREKEGQPILLTESQARIIFWTVFGLVPLLVLLAGLTVYRVRRSQR